MRFTTSNVNGQKVTLYTSISIKKVRASSSGNPGYLFGKPLQYVSGGIYSITDANQNCVTNSSVNPSSSLNIKFGINETFTCFTSTPCSSTLYIDQIPLASSFKPSKYAQPTTEPANIAAISSNCNIESYTFHILYSYSGWVMDPQYYIIGSTFTATQSVNPIRMKQLNVKWIKVEPSQVYTPPTNYFYTYF